MRIVLLAVGAVASAVGLLFAARRAVRRPLHVVEHLDVQRYMGRWYEIARAPHRFERGCGQGTATYNMTEDGTIEVVNACERGDRVDQVLGKAWVSDPQTRARLKVQFRWPFRGDYQVLHVDDAYEHAVVGEPGRRHAWILARRPTVSDETYQRLLRVLEDEGYAVERMIRMCERPTSTSEETTSPECAYDPVEQAGLESFPASDPPSYTPGHS